MANSTTENKITYDVQIKLGVRPSGKINYGGRITLKASDGDWKYEIDPSFVMNQVIDHIDERIREYLDVFARDKEVYIAASQAFGEYLRRLLDGKGEIES